MDFTGIFDVELSLISFLLLAEALEDILKRYSKGKAITRGED